MRWAALSTLLLGIALACATLVGFPVGGTIEPGAIATTRFDNGSEAYAVLPGKWGLRLRSDDLAEAQASTLKLFEDGRPLGPAHSLHADVGTLGKGRYSHWNGAIYFTASDNSDPRRNGKTYRFEDHVRLSREYLPLGLACAGASAAWLGRRPLGAWLAWLGARFLRGAGWLRSAVLRGVAWLRSGLLRAAAALASAARRARAALVAAWRLLPSIWGSTGSLAIAAARAIARLVPRVLPYGLFAIGLTLVYGWILGIPIQGSVPAGWIVPAQTEGGTLGYAFTPSQSAYLRDDEPDAPYVSTLRLFEDAVPLGPAHSHLVDIGTLGAGRYSHSHGIVYFSSSDNSDPRTNGRSYRYEDQGRLTLPYGLAGMAGALGSLLWLHRVRVRRVAERVSTNARIRYVPPFPLTAALMLGLVALLWLFQLLIATEADVSREDLPLLVTYCVLMLAAQGWILASARRLAAFLFVALGILDAYSLNFVFSSHLATQPAWVQLAMVLGPGGLYFVLYRWLERAERWRVPVLAGTALLAAGLGAVAVVEPFLPASATRHDVGPESLGLRTVEFAKRPNVYFLGFDAMMPERLADKLLNIGRPAYVDVIERHGGRILRNLFADEVPTLAYWGATFSILRSQEPRKVVLGVEPSLVLETFRRNGYDAHFSYVNSYMGPAKGPLLKTYAVAEAYSTCTFLDELPRRHGLLGYCALKDTGWFGPPPGDGTPTEGHDDFYLDRLRSVIRDAAARPQFFASHYPWPGHTKLGYSAEPWEFEEFSRTYRDRADDAARMLDRMLTEIRSRDPGGIVFVFGDHGPWISRRLDYSTQTPFVVQDRHGILGAVFGAERCMPYLGTPGARVHNSSLVVAGLLQCLANGESPLARPHDFGRISQAPGNLRFEDYAYE